jgi:membrane associated rhomboid family serine protease
MEEFKSKIRLIFLPFLCITFLVIVFITFLHWLLFIKFHALNIDEDVVNFFVPAIFPGLPILLFLRPRIILLKLNTEGRRNPIGLYIMLAWFTIGIAGVIAQQYIVTATGKLTALDNIYQVNKVPETKYYTVNTFYINKNFAHIKVRFYVSGKYNESFNMNIYACVPVFDHLFPDTSRIAAICENTDPKTLILINDTISTMAYLKKLPADSIRYMNHVNPSFVMTKYGDSGKYGAIVVITRGYKKYVKIPPLKIEPNAWLAIKFSKIISNNLDGADKEKLYRKFVIQSDTDFKHLPLDKFVYLSRIQYNSKDLKYYIEAIKSRDDVIGDSTPIFLLPQFGKFADRNGTHLQWTFGSLAIGSFIFLIALSFSKLKPEALEVDIKNHQRNEWLIALAWIKALFIPKKGRWGTQILIDLNLLIFLTMVFSGLGFISFDSADLLKWGANYRPAIVHHEYWRLLTNIFIHGGLLHILANMYGLFFAGIFLEPVIGTRKYLLAYFISGIAASLASIWWHYDTVSVGASGAIFGLYGVFFALLTVNVFPKGVKKSFLIMTSLFIIYNLLYGLSGGVDNAAHVGGLFSGLVIGYIIYPFVKQKIAEDKPWTENVEPGSLDG